MLDSRRWWLLLLALCLFPQAVWAGEAILNIRLGLQPDATRIVLDLSEPTAYRVGLLASPPRVYIEIPPAAAPAVLPLGRGLVQSVTLAGDSGLVRVVAYLKGPVKVTKADLIFGTGDGNSRRLVVDVSPASGLDFADALTAGPIDSNPPIVLGESEAGVAQSAPAAIPSAVAPPALAPPPAAVPPTPGLADNGMVLPMLRPGSAIAPAGSLPVLASQGGGQASSAQGAVTTAMTSALPVTPAALVTPNNIPTLRPGAAAGPLPLIYLDPGHGGVDPGTIGGDGVYEKTITLAMAKELQRQLLATGRYRVKMTRQGDQYVPLRLRFEMARRDHADMFISLHADSDPGSLSRGATVYTLSETASDAEAAALAAKENKADLIDGVDLSQQGTAVTSILIDLAQRETKNRSAAFAELLVHDMSGVTRLQRNSHRYAGFAVLKAPDIPSVLIELGYLSDTQDEALLISPLHRTKLAGAMLRAIDGYYAEMASGSRS
jgi:N-acetylmuramoyl-L-alanine amidase